MLREEILEILDLFNKFKIPEKDQKRIFREGIYFDFTYGEIDLENKNQLLSAYGVGILLKTCLENKIHINIKQLLKEPWKFPYEDLVKRIAELEKPSYIKVVDDIEEVMELFNKYKIPEYDQQRIIRNGIHFDFTYGDPDYNNINQTLDVYGVGTLLKTCSENKIRINIKQLLKEPWMFPDESLVKKVAEECRLNHIKIKKLGTNKD